jgi:calpain
LKLSDDLSYRGTYGIQPHGVAQGFVTDCWIMAAFSGVAESPERLERIITPLERKGLYEVKLFAQAKWWRFVVDDLMPTRKSGKYLKYAKPAIGDAIWPMILEKAMAKFHTSYE